jgi:hypothetical protein
MLRRRGIVSKLCLGVEREGEDLTTRAWIVNNGQVIFGFAAAKRATLLGEFGE